MAHDKTLPMLLLEAEEITRDLLENGGEISEELEAKISLHDREFKSKLDCYGFILDVLMRRQEFITEKLAAWSVEATKCDRARENLKSRIKSAMERMDFPEVHGFEYSFRLQSNPPSVIISDESKIPGEFITIETKTTNKISKKDILDAIKDGREIPGAHIERSTRLITKVSQRNELESTKAVEKI